MKRLGRRTILIAAVLCVLAAIVVGNTAYGYFMSGVTVENNKVKSGEIHLQVNDGGAVVPINLDDGVNDIMPGDHGTVGNYKLVNTGNVHSSLYVGVAPAGDWDAGLGDVLTVAFWLDKTNDGLWNSGDAYFVPNGRYVEWAEGDPLGVPAAAYHVFNDWRNAWSNTLNVDGTGTAGWLKFTYNWPTEEGVITPETLMGKSCNFNMMVELHQYHPVNKHASGATSGHSGATWAAYANGVLINQGTLSGATFDITLPADVYTIVFTQGSWTYSKVNLDMTIIDQPFDLPA